jgi:hypothetical protein
VVAYAILLQAFLLSLAGAAHAAPGADPQAVLCAYDGTSGPHDPSGQTAHTGLCCILGCQGFAAAPGPAPSGAVQKPLRPASIRVEPSYERVVTRVSSTVLPLGSRAPPRLG